MAESKPAANEPYYEGLMCVLRSELVQAGMDRDDAYRALAQIWAVAYSPRWIQETAAEDDHPDLAQIRSALGQFRHGLAMQRRRQFDAEIAQVRHEHEEDCHAHR